MLLPSLAGGGVALATVEDFVRSLIAYYDIHKRTHSSCSTYIRTCKHTYIHV